MAKKIKVEFIDNLIERLESDIDVNRLHKSISVLAQRESQLVFDSNVETVEEMKSEIIKFYKNRELDKIKRKN